MKPCITIRPTPVDKQRFAELARIRGVSQSTLALVALHNLLRAYGPEIQEIPPDGPETSMGPARDRITIRLRPGDRQWLRAHAKARGMHDSAYLAALVRAHRHGNPTLPSWEYKNLAVMVRGFWSAISEISKLRRTAASTGQMTPELQQQLADLSRRIEEVEQGFHQYAQAALKSWEIRHG